MSKPRENPVRVERANAETTAVAALTIPGGYPELTASQLDLIRERSTETVVDAGASVASAGDVDFDFMLVEAGDLEVVRLAAFGLPEQVMAIFGPGSFLGELDMLTGQAALFFGAYARRRGDPTDATSGLPAAHVRRPGAVRRHSQGVHGTARVPSHERSGAQCPDRRRCAVGRDARAPQLGHASKRGA
jgi:CRP-like cAMP-binding protein